MNEIQACNTHVWVSHNETHYNMKLPRALMKEQQNKKITFNFC